MQLSQSLSAAVCLRFQGRLVINFRSALINIVRPSPTCRRSQSSRLLAQQHTCSSFPPQPGTSFLTSAKSSGVIPHSSSLIPLPPHSASLLFTPSCSTSCVFTPRSSLLLFTPPHLTSLPALPLPSLLLLLIPRHSTSLLPAPPTAPDSTTLHCAPPHPFCLLLNPPHSSSLPLSS